MLYRIMICFLNVLFFICSINLLSAQTAPTNQKQDSAKAKSVMKDAKIKPDKKNLEITIRNVDITQFPLVSIIVEAYNKYGEPLDTLTLADLSVMENNIEKKVISIEKISVKERVPVDFIFAIDKTGSMQKYIDAVRKEIFGFTQSITRRGIDFRLGLVLFSDEIENIYQPSDNVNEFSNVLSKVKAYGGKDEKENALEALEKITKMNFRPAANRVVVLITDAPYHQAGERGDGSTDQTTASIIEMLQLQDLRVFSLVPPRLVNYQTIANETRGNVYDLDYSFSTILDLFSTQLTNLFAIKYRTDEPAIPDSINIALLNEKKQELVRKIIPIIELGRKLIIENLLYETNSYELSDSVPELEILFEFMTNKQNVDILVEGHTDSRGSHALNDALSTQRAESVKRYLIRKGIDAKRIKTKGYGKRKPIASNDTEFGRAMNRRTEIVINKK